MQINEATICFVNSHLAAHASEVDRRKEDHDEIVQRMHFGNARRCIDDHEYVTLLFFFHYLFIYLFIVGEFYLLLPTVCIVCSNCYFFSCRFFVIPLHAVTYFGSVTSTTVWSTIHRAIYSK